MGRDHQRGTVRDHCHRKFLLIYLRSDLEHVIQVDLFFGYKTRKRPVRGEEWSVDAAQYTSLTAAERRSRWTGHETCGANIGKIEGKVIGWGSDHYF